MSIEMTMLLAVLLPPLASVLILLLGRWPNIRELVTLGTAVGLAWLVLPLIPQVLAATEPLPRVTLIEMLPGLELAFRLEPLGMIFAGIASILWVANSLYAIGYMRNNNEQHQTVFYACFPIALASAMGIAFSANLLTLFVFYEVLSFSTYPLVTHKRNRDAVKAGRTYLGILVGTSVGLLMIAILWTWHVAGTLEFTQGGILAGKVEGWTLGILLALFVYGIGKAALMPVHRWLPAAMVAPTPVSAVLHAVAVVKAGVFSVIKIMVYVFGLDTLSASEATQWLAYIAGFTIISASVVALMADNLKRRLAYSTISQLSYVVITTAVFAQVSVMAAALHIVAHAFGKITLFYAAGSIYTASHKTEISQLVGIGRKMPITMCAFTLGALSMIGLPPTVGFISKWYMLMGAWQAEHVVVMVVIVMSTLLNAAYFLPIIYRAFAKPPTDDVQHGEAPRLMLLAMMFTAGMTVLLFFWHEIPVSLAWQLVGGRP